MGIIPEGMNIFGGVGGALETFKYIMGGILLFIIFSSIITLFIYRRFQKKKFNIPLVIITPRSDGRVVEINNGLGGYFKSKKVGGITSFRVKRKGIGVVDIPPPPSSYLASPNRTLFLAQKGVDDYEPIMPYELGQVTVPSGEKFPILELKALNQDATAWHCDNQESAKRRFTFTSLWEKYQVLLTLMTFVFILFLVLYINWLGMKDVVAGLADVAEQLKSIVAPIITPGG